MNYHIRLVIAIHVHETQRDRDQLFAIAIKLWSDIDARFRGVPTGELDDLNATIQVDYDKVAWIGCRVIMSNHHIYLKCARVSILDIVPRIAPPAGCQRQ